MSIECTCHRFCGKSALLYTSFYIRTRVSKPVLIAQSKRQSQFVNECSRVFTPRKIQNKTPFQRRRCPFVHTYTLCDTCKKKNSYLYAWKIHIYIHSILFLFTKFIQISKLIANLSFFQWKHMKSLKSSSLRYLRDLFNSCNYYRNYIIHLKNI